MKIYFIDPCYIQVGTKAQRKMKTTSCIFPERKPLPFAPVNLSSYHFLLIMAHFNQKWNHNRMHNKVWLLPISGLIKAKELFYFQRVHGLQYANANGVSLSQSFQSSSISCSFPWSFPWPYSTLEFSLLQRRILLSILLPRGLILLIFIKWLLPVTSWLQPGGAISIKSQGLFWPSLFPIWKVRYPPAA